MTKKKHNPAFKTRVAVAVIKGAETTTQIASKFDIPLSGKTLEKATSGLCLCCV